MGKSINKFIVKLSDLSNFKPKLTITVSVVKEKANTYLIKLIHPNYTLSETKKKIYNTVYEEEFVSEKSPVQAISDAIAKGKEILERPEIQIIAMQTTYIEQIFIPQGRRGKVKLKTKATADAEAAEAAALLEPEEEELVVPEGLELVLDEVTDDEDALPVEDEEQVEENLEEDDEESSPKKKKKVKNKIEKKKVDKNKKAAKKVEKPAKKVLKAKKKVVAKNKKKKK